MKQRIVYVENVAALQEASDALIHRHYGLPGMGLVWGPTGAGKTTATTWLINQVHGIYVRANAQWSSASMLESLLREFNHKRTGNCAQMLDAVVRQFAETRRPLFVDEADYLIESKKLVETLRDIHDLTEVPVILVGMEEIKTKIGRRQQLAGRIAREVLFSRPSEQDVRLLARELSELELDAALLADLHVRTAGSIRGVVVGLSRVDDFAQQRGLRALTLADLPKGFSYVTGAPKPRKSNLRRIESVMAPLGEDRE